MYTRFEILVNYVTTGTVQVYFGIAFYLVI